MKITASGIAVMAFCALLAFLPAGASDFTLGIFGNANMDDTIDQQDIEYVQGIIDGTNEPTLLADANYDGIVDENDIVRILKILNDTNDVLTIVDSHNRVVTIPVPIIRIVSFASGLVENTRSLGKSDLLVGFGQAANDDAVFFSEFQGYPNLGDEESPDIEKIIELQPDVVFVNADYSAPILEDNPDLRVVYFYNAKPTAFVEEITKLGYMLGSKRAGDELVDFYTTNWVNIAERISEIPMDDRKAVYFELYRDYQTPRVDSLYSSLIDAAGGDNIFKGLGGEIDPEEILVKEPDVIIRLESRFSKNAGYQFDSEDIQGLKSIHDDIVSRTELANCPAVKDDNVHVIANHVVGSGARHIVALSYFAKWLYPEKFEDIDPKDIHQRYLSEFQGLDIDLDKQGVFVYPELDDI